jgi:hypothetical protein
MASIESPYVDTNISLNVTLSSSELNNLTENNNNDLHSYWTINQLNKIDVDINDDPNIINVIKAFGI